MKEDFEAWLNQAKSDLEKARVLAEKGYYDGSTFYSQQTAEKSLKAVWLSKGNDLIKIHDLLQLGKKVGLTGKMLEKAVSLNPFYSASRYPWVKTEDINSEDAERIINFAEEILEWCKKQIKI